MNTKLHAVTEAEGRPIRLFMTAGQVSDYTGAVALLGSLPKAEWLLADCGHDADWFREALKDKGIKPRLPGRSAHGESVGQNKRRYKRCNRIEINFGRSKDLTGALPNITIICRPSHRPVRRPCPLQTGGLNTSAHPDITKTRVSHPSATKDSIYLIADLCLRNGIKLDRRHPSTGTEQEKEIRQSG